MKRKLLILFIVFFLLVSSASAVEFFPNGDIIGRGIRAIYNFTDINATNFFGDGNVTASFFFGDGSQLTNVAGGGGGNTSFNESYTDTLYLDINENASLWTAINLRLLTNVFDAENTSLWSQINTNVNDIASNLAKLLGVNITVNLLNTNQGVMNTSINLNIANVGSVNDTLNIVNKTSNIENLNFTQGVHTVDTDTNESVRIGALEVVQTADNLTLAGLITTNLNNIASNLAKILTVNTTVVLNAVNIQVINGSVVLNSANIQAVNNTLNTVSTKVDNVNITSNIEGLGFNITTDLTTLYDDRYLTSQLNLYFYNDSDSFNNTYTIMNITLPTGAVPQINTFSGLVAGDTEIANRILSTLQLSLLQTGAYNQHTTINYTAGTKNVQLKSVIYKRLANGSEIQIGNSPVSSILVPGSYQQVIWTGTISTETMFATGDFLVMKLIAVVSGGGSAPTIDLVVADETAARLDIGIDPIDILIDEIDPFWSGNESRVTALETSNTSTNTKLDNVNNSNNILDLISASDIDTSGDMLAANFSGSVDFCIEGGTCLSDAGVGSGDITAVNTNGDYLIGGATSGAVSLLLNDTFLNLTIDDRDTNANTICVGTGNYLDGEGNCDALVTNTDAQVLSLVGGSNVTISGGNSINISGVDTDTTYTNGSGISLVGTEFNHTDTSSQASSDNSGRTYIQDILLDTFGHITGITTATETIINVFASTIDVTGTTTKTINITLSNGTEVKGSFTDIDTTYSAGNGIGLSTTTFSVAGNTALTQDSDGLSVTAGGIGDTQLAFNTGQALTSTSAPTFVTVDTGQGANELYDMDQNVLITSDVIYNTAKITNDLNMTSNNITLVDCVLFRTGGSWCSS